MVMVMVVVLVMLCNRGSSSTRNACLNAPDLLLLMVIIIVLVLVLVLVLVFSGVCWRRDVDQLCGRSLERRAELRHAGCSGEDGGELGEQQRQQPVRGKLSPPAFHMRYAPPGLEARFIPQQVQWRIRTTRFRSALLSTGFFQRGPSQGWHSFLLWRMKV